MLTTGMGGLFTGLARVVLIVALLAGMGGAALAGTDLLNFNTSSAAARAQDVETQYRAQKQAIDLEGYRELVAAQTEAEKEVIRLEVGARKRELEAAYEHQLRQAEQDLALERQTRRAELIALILAVLIVGSGLSYYLVQQGRSRLLEAQARVEATADPWRDPSYRADRIRYARLQALAEGKAAAAEPEPAAPTARRGNGHEVPAGQASEERLRHVA